MILTLVKRFVGVTVTNGGGSARMGAYAQKTDEELIEIRHGEQNIAAALGDYAAQIQLRYPSSAIKGTNPQAGDQLVSELVEILSAAKPKIIYTHNPFDKHETHVAVMAALLRALPIYLKECAPEDRPEKIYGCEVWRGLDWVPDSMKVALDVSSHTDLQRALIGAHDSQIAGSKGYVGGTLGRETANAVYSNPHALDDMKAATLALDMSEFLRNPHLTLAEFMQPFIDGFTKEVTGMAARVPKIGMRLE